MILLGRECSASSLSQRVCSSRPPSGEVFLLILVLGLDQLGAVDAADVHLVGPHHDAVTRPAGEVATPPHGAVMPALGCAQLHAQPHTFLEVHAADVLDDACRDGRGVENNGLSILLYTPFFVDYIHHIHHQSTVW